jgi:hypothetical protein
VAIVDVDRLNRFMSSPRWTEDQREEAADLLEEVEGSLADRLNTKISPVDMIESAPILDTGLVSTRYPVFSVSRLNGVDIVNDVLPSGWVVSDHWLRTQNPPGFFSLPSVPFTLGDWPSTHTAGIGTASLTYKAGLGNVPAIRLAILRKSAVIFNNRHDDTIVVRDLDATEPVKLGPEDWSELELANLSRFYNHAVFK